MISIDEVNEVLKIQSRIQQLYSIDLFSFTVEDRKELIVLENKMDSLGYRRIDKGDIGVVCYAKHNTRGG